MSIYCATLISKIFFFNHLPKRWHESQARASREQIDMGYVLSSHPDGK
jgi:hypothetical protein